MKTESKNLFKIAFGIAFIILFAGSIMKIMHIDFANIILGIGLLATLSYIFIGISEVNKSTKLRDSKKTFFTICFISFSFFTGLYYLVNRKSMV